MKKSITMSFSVPLELSIQMEEWMENTGFNRSELLQASLLEYFKDQKEKDLSMKKIELCYAETLKIKETINKFLK